MVVSRTFKERLVRGDKLYGSILTLNDPSVAEVMAMAGFDWLWLDMEHGPVDIADAQRLLQAVSDRCATLVRAPSNDSVWIKRILDLGCAGVIIPQVNSREEAAAAVAACRYPPDGIRSVGIARAQGYGC